MVYIIVRRGKNDTTGRKAPERHMAIIWSRNGFGFVVSLTLRTMGMSSLHSPWRGMKIL